MVLCADKVRKCVFQLRRFHRYNRALCVRTKKGKIRITISYLMVLCADKVRKCPFSQLRRFHRCSRGLCVRTKTKGTRNVSVGARMARYL